MQHNPFMEWFETDSLKRGGGPNIKPSVWFKYVDDVVETIHKDNVDEFKPHLISYNLSIQFIVELHGEDQAGINISLS